MGRGEAMRSTVGRLAALAAFVAVTAVGLAAPSAARPTTARTTASAAAPGDGPYTFTIDAPASSPRWRHVPLTYSLTGAGGVPPPRTQILTIIDGRVYRNPLSAASGTVQAWLPDPGPHLVAMLAVQQSADGATSTWIAATPVVSVTITHPPAPGTPLWGYILIEGQRVTGLPTPAGFDGSIAADGTVTGTLATEFTTVVGLGPIGCCHTAVVRLADTMLTGHLDASGRLEATATTKLELAALSLFSPDDWFAFFDATECKSLPWTFSVTGSYHDGDLDLLALDVPTRSPATGTGCGGLRQAILDQAGPSWGSISFLLRAENPPSAFTPTG